MTERIPEIIPYRCGDCDYFKGGGKSLLHFYWGKCEFYKEETHTNSECIAVKKYGKTPNVESIPIELVNPNIVVAIVCPNCGVETNLEAKFCKKCGIEISPKQMVTIAFCEKCNSEYGTSYKFCEKDGSKLILKKVKKVEDVESSTSTTNTLETPGLDVKLNKASFGQRLMAYLFDLFIVTFVSFLIGMAFQYSPIRGLIIAFIFNAIYYIGFWSSRGATPGKILMKLKVVDENGNIIDGGTACIRFLGYIVSGIVFLLGFIWVAFDQEKQGWHDKMARTYVIVES